MIDVQTEIAALEERLVAAELGKDPTAFEELLADDVVLVGQDGEPFPAKRRVIEAHPPGIAKFRKVEFRDVKIVDHGQAAVVTCRGVYETGNSTFTLKFMRVWFLKGDLWQVIAGSVSD